MATLDVIPEVLHGAVTPPNVTRLLLVEDNPADADLVQEVLESVEGPSFALARVSRLGAALTAIAETHYDAVLLDLSLPDSQGMETVRKIRAAAPRLPVVVLTGFDDLGLALRSLREGVQEYVVKSQFDGISLGRAIRYALERQALSSALEKSRCEQLRFKDEFLSQVSHELRTPLTCIDQFAGLLADGAGGPVSAGQREYLGIILRNVRQLHHMINDLLEVTRAEAGKLEINLAEVPLEEVMEEALQSLRATATERHIGLGWLRPPGEAHRVIADRQRVLEMLANLLDNALKFTPENGSVRVGIDGNCEPGYARAFVADTGCGISPESQLLIFERMYQERSQVQRSRKGLGLGLYIAKQLVTLQGGRIWVDSQPGRGSIFSFTLPLAPEIAPARRTS